MTQYESYLGRVLSERYTLVSIIGEGESSVVFGAYDGKTGQTVALKMLAPDRASDTEATHRFLSEVEVLSLFDHPNIVKLLDTSLEGDLKFFVMEYIEGITLKKHITSKGTLSEEEILFLSRPILSALGEVHDKGVIHSDIKPQNVVLVGSGEIKLMDFGISRRLSAQDSEPSEITMGTVQYVSPEQAEGKPLSHLSDIYSFGVMLYEMATGNLPFSDEDSGRIAAMHVASAPIPPALLLPSISGHLSGVILHAMEKDPAARPFSASELFEELANKQEPIEESLAPEPRNIQSLIQEVKALPRKLHLPSCLIGILSALFLSVVISLLCLFSALSKQEREMTFVRIPDLVGEPYISTEALGIDEDLYRIKVEYVSFPARGGQILHQTPKADKRMRRGDEPLTVTVTVARLTLPKEMPNLKGMTEAEAREYLSRYECEVTVSLKEHDYFPTGYVCGSSPAEGERASQKITLYIAQ